MSNTSQKPSATLSRRQVLQAGALGLGGLSMGDARRIREVPCELGLKRIPR